MARQQPVYSRPRIQTVLAAVGRSLAIEDAPDYADKKFMVLTRAGPARKIMKALETRSPKGTMCSASEEVLESDEQDGRKHASALKRSLLESLGAMPRFDRCALLDYPDHLNAGDHFIWLGSLFYLTMEQRAEVAYTASPADFSRSELDRRVGRSPIVLQGGGNLGDLWPESQEFREMVISTYGDRSIVVLPQSMYFRDAANLERAARVFNAHPDLTLFLRERVSYQLAVEHFPRCQVILAPDMAYYLEGLPRPAYRPASRHKLAYLCRADAELTEQFSPERASFKDFVCRDWATYEWVYKGRGQLRDYRKWYWRLPGATSLFREGWQRGLSRPALFASRLGWHHLEPYASILRSLGERQFARFSWGILHDSLCQLMECELVTTNRLHGRLASSLLGIPGIFLPNAYHKNESFFRSWWEHDSRCRFVTDPAKIREAADELLSLAVRAQR